MSPTTTSGKSTNRRAVWYSFLRIVVGFVLIWKGGNFLIDTAAMQLLLGHNIAGELTKGDAVLIVIFGVITLLCGFLIIIGRFIRFTSLVQLPVFLMGILFIHGGHIERNGFELILTIIVPFLLLFFITKDNYDLQI